MGTTLRRAGLLLAVVAVALIGTSAASAADGNGNGGWLPLVTICHKPSQDGGTTMEVNVIALFLHLLHGDSFGACKAPPVDENDGGSQGDEERSTSRSRPASNRRPATSRSRPASNRRPATSRSRPASNRRPATSRSRPASNRRPATSRSRPASNRRPATSRSRPASNRRPARSRTRSHADDAGAPVRIAGATGGVPLAVLCDEGIGRSPRRRRTRPCAEPAGQRGCAARRAGSRDACDLLRRRRRLVRRPAGVHLRRLLGRPCRRRRAGRGRLPVLHPERRLTGTRVRGRGTTVAAVGVPPQRVASRLQRRPVESRQRVWHHHAAHQGRRRRRGGDLAGGHRGSYRVPHDPSEPVGRAK